MSVLSVIPHIQILPSLLADQIAAGEVIDRPASVIKELVENSLDAGAHRLDIELMQGGTQLVRVNDDGHGIRGQELSLAICRHATSKIREVNDLLNLHSLGFRGEALASICSVSQWELLSHSSEESQAFRISHRDADPVAVNHAVGTTMSVANLFYNTPARRKFLRSEQTEYRHCEDLLKRLALSRFDVGFYLKHNQRQVWKLPATQDDVSRSRRVRDMLGDAFLQQTRMIDYQHQGLRLWGWLATPDYSRQQSDLQYFYINGRIIRDRIINHAVRHAYANVLHPGRQPAYVLYLEISPHEVDVNVHPTKHEVRFHQGRLIHDFIARCVRDSLAVATSGLPTMYAETPTGIPSDINLVRDVAAEYSPGKISHSTGSTVAASATVIFGRYWVRQQNNVCEITDLLQVRSCLFRLEMLKHAQGAMPSRPLLLPQVIELDQHRLLVLEQRQSVLSELGFDISITGPSSILLRAVPVGWPTVQLDVQMQTLCALELSTQAASDIKSLLVDELSNLLLQLPMPEKIAELQMLYQNSQQLKACPDNWRFEMTLPQWQSALKSPLCS